MKGGKRPGDALRICPYLHLVVFLDVDAIVVGKEIVVAHATEGKDGNCRKDEADGGALPQLICWCRDGYGL